MRKDQDCQERLNPGKRRRMRRKKIVQGAMIVILCVLTFLGGRASAEANSDQNEEESTGAGVTEPEAVAPEAAGAETQADREADSDDWNLILINRSHPISDTFRVDLAQLKNGQAVDKRAYPDLQDMMDDARAAGLEPYICSSYRTMEKQTSLYNQQVEKYLAQGYSEEEAKIEAGKWVAVPGTSEHQLGLAVDIVSKNYQILDKQQESTPEQQWLMENCYKYGFILRYPEAKSDITGISFEPWHYRYVGKKAAAEIMEKGICLEEYHTF